MENLKKLYELDAKYDGKHIADLVGAVNKMPLLLPNNQEYFFRMEDSIIHVYGRQSAITEYGINETNDGYSLRGVKHDMDGIRILLGESHKMRGIERTVILHTKPNKNLEAKITAGTVGPSSSYQFSNYNPPSESRAISSSGESRASRGSGESRY